MVKMLVLDAPNFKDLGCMNLDNQTECTFEWEIVAWQLFEVKKEHQTDMSS